MLVAGVPLWIADTNAWVIASGRDATAVVIDAPPDATGVVDLLDRHGLAPVALLLTHGHVDHVGSAGRLVDHYALSAYIHPDDEFLYRDPEAQMRALWGMALPGDFAPPTRWEALHAGDQLHLAGIDVDVLHTPGHSPGHCCFHVPAEGLLFSGDQLFAGSIGRTDLPGGDYDTLMASMRERIIPLPAETTVFPGHGPTTTLAAELATNPFLQDFRP